MGNLAEAGKYVATGGRRQMGIIPILRGGDTGCISVWVRVLGAIRRNDAGGGGNPQGVSNSDQW